MKYIMIEHPMYELDTPILFDNVLAHRRVKETMDCGVVSAGFVKIDWKEKTVFCYGRSESLNIASRGAEDSQIVAAVLGLV